MVDVVEMMQMSNTRKNLGADTSIYTTRVRANKRNRVRSIGPCDREDQKYHETRNFLRQDRVTDVYIRDVYVCRTKSWRNEPITLIINER